MKPPIQLVTQRASHELVSVVRGLLEAAEAGSMTGLVFGASFQGQRYYCDAAGALHRSPVAAIGVATMLTAEMEHRIRREAQETVI